jgi:hypothetical protein
MNRTITPDDIYTAVVLLADVASARLWEQRPWRQLTEYLGALFEASEEAPRIDVRQVDLTRQRPLRFDGLTWDNESFSRWTHVSDGAEDRLFEGISVSIPASMDSLWPDVYFEVSAPYQPRHFGQAILIAVRTQLGRQPQMEELVKHLENVTSPVVVGYSSRRFSYPSGGAFVRSLDHLLSEEILSLDRAKTAPSLTDLNRASSSMTRRTGVTVPPWSSPLPYRG